MHSSPWVGFASRTTWSWAKRQSATSRAKCYEMNRRLLTMKSIRFALMVMLSLGLGACDSDNDEYPDAASVADSAAVDAASGADAAETTDASPADVASSTDATANQCTGDYFITCTGDDVQGSCGA